MRSFQLSETTFPRLEPLRFGARFWHLHIWLVVDPTPLKNDGLRQLG